MSETTMLRDALAMVVESIDYCHKTRHLRHADQPKGLRMAGEDCYCSVNESMDLARKAIAAVRSETLAGSGVVEDVEKAARWGIWAAQESHDGEQHDGSFERCGDKVCMTARRAGIALAATPPTPTLTAARLEPHWHARTCWRRAMPETMDHRCSCGLDAAVAALGTGTDWCRYAMGAEVCGWPPSGKMHGTGPDQHPFQPAHATPEEAER